MIMQLLVNFCQSQIECHSSYQCYLNNLLELSNQDNNFECYGDNSCRQVENIVSQNHNDLYCYGAYSCYKVDNIKINSSTQSNGTGVNTISCDGLYACALAHIKSTTSTPFNLSCYGELSCYNTKYLIDTNMPQYPQNIAIDCFGDRSCKESTIHSIDKTKINMYGYLSGQNANFISDKSTENGSYYYYFYGHNSGSGANVTCSNGDTCEIICYSSGCNNIRYACNGCESLTINCTHAQKSDACPYGM